MSEKTIAIKAQKVEEIADQFKNAASAVVVDARGLTVAQSTELRHQLREEGIVLEVIKNKILTRAAEKAGFAELNDIFASFFQSCLQIVGCCFVKTFLND